MKENKNKNKKNSDKMAEKVIVHPLILPGLELREVSKKDNKVNFIYIFERKSNCQGQFFYLGLRNLPLTFLLTV